MSSWNTLLTTLMIKQMVGVYQQTELLQYSKYSHPCYVVYIRYTHARTHFHLDMTLPHNTAGSEAPLQLAEVLGEASHLLGPAHLSSSSCLAAKRELERKLKWRNNAMELFTS